MDHISLAVKLKAPKMGAMEIRMRFVGQTELAAFLRVHPGDADRLQAWASEMRNRNWKNVEALAADFQNLDASRSPLIVFRFGRPPLHIETLIDFRTNVVLLLCMREPQLHFGKLQQWGQQRDN